MKGYLRHVFVNQLEKDGYSYKSDYYCTHDEDARMFDLMDPISRENPENKDFIG